MKKSTIAIAVATAMGSSAAMAAPVTLDRVSTGSSNGASDAFALIGGGTWDLTGADLSLTGNSTHKFRINPISNLFDHSLTDVSINLKDGSTGGTYECVEGNFGGNVGAGLCANISFGANFVNETTLNYNTTPGTRKLGGDDTAAGPMQQLSDYSPSSFDITGTILTVNTAGWDADPGAAGIQYVFSGLAPIPVPAAAWLFGSALGLLGWARRRA